MRIEFDSGILLDFQQENFLYKFSGIFPVDFKSQISKKYLFKFLSSICSNYHSALQVADPSSIVSWRHIAISVYKALRSFKNGRNISRRVEIEVLLYLSGCRQIKDALKIVGVKEHFSNIILIIFSKDLNSLRKCLKIFLEKFEAELNGKIFSSFGENTNHLMKLYNISSLELESMVRGNLPFRDALELIVIERGSLLDVEKH